MPTSSLNQAAGRPARITAPLTRSLILITVSTLLHACGNDRTTSPPGQGGGNKPPDATGNYAPSISGTPPAVATVNTPYEFQPKAYDPNGDVLVFQVSRLPLWAKFDPATGEISGVPPKGAIGTFTDIKVTVTDGAAKSALPAFSITVTDPNAPTPSPTPGTGIAKLSWSAPTQNDDGSALTNLTGYRIYYGTSPGDLGQRLEIENPGATMAEVPGLATGTWYFAMTSVNAAGVESARTHAISMSL